LDYKDNLWIKLFNQDDLLREKFLEAVASLLEKRREQPMDVNKFLVKEDQRSIHAPAIFDEGTLFMKRIKEALEMGISIRMDSRHCAMHVGFSTGLSPC